MKSIVQERIDDKMLAHYEVVNEEMMIFISFKDLKIEDLDTSLVAYNHDTYIEDIQTNILTKNNNFPKFKDNKYMYFTLHPDLSLKNLSKTVSDKIKEYIHKRKCKLDNITFDNENRQLAIKLKETI